MRILQIGILVMVLLTGIASYGQSDDDWSGSMAADATPGSAAQFVQKIAIPSYFYPCTGNTGCYWDRLNSGSPKVGMAIINPNSGPGPSVDPNYVDQVTRSQAAGVIVLGYVHTSWGKRGVEEVKAEVDLYYDWYHVDGIFFDEASTDCCLHPTYQDLFDYVKAKSKTQNKVVLNPGTNAPECYITACDILINYEDNYSQYAAWQPSGWEYKYPAARFWHLVINASQSVITKTIGFSRAKHAGWVYVTPDKLYNPWDTLPSQSYWNKELSLVH